jgi:cell division protein FtsA
MNGTSDYVMAFDLGSSRIVGGLGKKTENGQLRILAMEQRPVDSEIRHGIVHNIEEVAATIKELKEILSQSHTPPMVVNHVYTGINGYTIRTKDVRIDSLLGGTEIFTEKELDELNDQIPEFLPEGFFPVNVYQQEFLVDGKVDRNPVGSMPKRVEANFKVVGGVEDVISKTEAAFKNIKLSSCTLLGPVASAEAVLTAEEKTKGVVCVDFGAETTSVCIYKGELVRYVSVLPFGGRSITLDLLQLNMDEEDAEQIKLIQGTALHHTEMEVKEEEEALSREFKEINDIIVARVEEIIENIWAQISRSGIESVRLLSGIVMTGGASRLPGLDTLLARKTGMNVRIGIPTMNLEPESASIYGKLELSRCVGLLLQGEDGCFPLEATPRVEVKPLTGTDQTLEGFPVETPKPVPPKKEKKVKEPKPKKEKGKKIQDFLSGITDFLNNDN